MNWESIDALTADAMRFPIDRYVVQHVLSPGRLADEPQSLVDAVVNPLVQVSR